MYFNSDMVSRIRFLANPKIIMGNRLTLPEESTPSVMASRTFITELLEYLFIVANLSNSHFCTDLCQQTLQVLIYKDGSLARDLVSR